MLWWQGIGTGLWIEQRGGDGDDCGKWPWMLIMVEHGMAREVRLFKVLVIAVMRTAMAWLCGFVEHHGFVVKDAKLMSLVIIRIEFAVMLVMLVMEKWCGEEVMGL
jgi:hypothetical protein